jgi:hypothetical protein
MVVQPRLAVSMGVLMSSAFPFSPGPHSTGMIPSLGGCPVMAWPIRR